MAEAQDASDVLDAIEFEAQRQRVPVHMISMTRLDREAKTEGHQGVMALADPLNTVTLEQLLGVKKPFLLVCDGVTDPRNLGAASFLSSHDQKRCRSHPQSVWRADWSSA